MHLITLFIGGGRTISDTAVIDMDQLQTNFINPKAHSNGMYMESSWFLVNIELFSFSIDMKDMWQCAAHLIASIIGTPDKMTHFWSHLFFPESLVGTFIPGSTVRWYYS